MCIGQVLALGSESSQVAMCALLLEDQRRRAPQDVKLTMFRTRDPGRQVSIPTIESVIAMVKAAWTQTKRGLQDIIDEDNGGRWILAQGSRWEVWSRRGVQHMVSM